MPSGKEIALHGRGLIRNVSELGRIGWTDHGLSRIAYGAAYAEGRDFVRSRMETAGMATRIDRAGNLFGWYEGTEPDQPAILAGSHLDSVPGGGIYDGAYGVLAAFEAAKAVHAQGPHTRTIEVVGFTAEEGGDLGGTFGSRAFTGMASETPALALERAGITAADVAASKADPSRYAAYLELHIEQGPVLWRKKIAIGIPTAIVGITRYEVTITGEANHAGTTPMKERHDAMRTAARILDRWFASIADRTDMVSTVGVFRLEPGVAPVVPGTAVFTLELRSTDDAITGKAAGEFRSLLSADEECTGSMRLLVSKPAVRLDPTMQDTIEEACRDLGVPCVRMPSGASHDASPIAHVIPTGMIFAPSVRGISHSKDEYTSPDDLVRGAEVLARTIRRIDEAATAAAG